MRNVDHGDVIEPEFEPPGLGLGRLEADLGMAGLLSMPSTLPATENALKDAADATRGIPRDL
jgi:hypothetical protein